MSNLTLSIACIISLATVALAFPDGAPSAACYTMVPGHFPSTATGASPFTLTVSSTFYSPGSTITGTLTSATKQAFGGFMIMAGNANNGTTIEEPLGVFTVVDAKTQQLVCGANNNQGVTHKDAMDKTVVNFTWTAPAKASGNIYFRASVVQGFSPSVFWLGIFSPAVKASGPY